MSGNKRFIFLKVSSLKIFLLIWCSDLFFYLGKYFYMPIWIYFYFPCILISEICFIFMLISCIQIKILLFTIDISTGHKNNKHKNPELFSWFSEIHWDFESCVFEHNLKQWIEDNHRDGPWPNKPWTKVIEWLCQHWGDHEKEFKHD